MSAEIIDLEQQRLYRQQLRAAALFVLLGRTQFERGVIDHEALVAEQQRYEL